MHGDMPYHDYSTFLVNRYGRPMYRVPIDLGLGCPNRTTDGGGCIFCDARGGRADFLPANASPAEQVRTGTAFLSKYRKKPALMAYFQAYTSTNAAPELLRERFDQTLKQADFEAVTVSTRPDCLPPEVLELLCDLKKAHDLDLWVEIGVQTSDDATLQRIQRGHDFACVANAIERVAAHSLPCAAHVVLGLPGETVAHYDRTAQQLAALPLSGIKLHNLHVLRDTALAEMWRRGKIETLDPFAYAEVLMRFLTRIPASWPVMRLVTDSAPEDRLAPQWDMTKSEFLHYLQKQMQTRSIHQGMSLTACRQHPVPRSTAVSATPGSSRREIKRTAALRKRAGQLLAAARITQDSGKRDTQLLDLGFGAGFSGLEAVRMYEHTGGSGRCRVTCCPLLADDLRAPCPLHHVQPYYAALMKDRRWRGLRSSARLITKPEDLFDHCSPGCFDVIILEPKFPEKYDTVLTPAYLEQLYRLLAREGLLVTALTAQRIRNALNEAGFVLGCAPRSGLYKGGTTASKHRLTSAGAQTDHRDRQVRHAVPR